MHHNTHIFALIFNQCFISVFTYLAYFYLIIIAYYIEQGLMQVN